MRERERPRSANPSGPHVLRDRLKISQEKLAATKNLDSRSAFLESRLTKRNALRMVRARSGETLGMCGRGDRTVIDWEREKLVRIPDATKFIPTYGSRAGAAVSTIYKWVTVGCEGIVLESVKIGRKRFTSEEAVKRFLAQLGSHRAGKPPRMRTLRERTEAGEKAGEELGRIWARSATEGYGS